MTSFLEGRSDLNKSTSAPALSSSRGENTAISAKAVSSANAAATGFQPFFSAIGRQPVLPQPETPDTEPVTLNAMLHSRAAGSTLHDAPQVELVTRDGKIERIIVTCTCCERIELECQY